MTEHHGRLSEAEARTLALESLLRERGLVHGAAMQEIIERYQTDVGPLNGARAVARAWVDPDYRARLLSDTAAALAEVGVADMDGYPITALENTAEVHNVVVCTLCSCYPWKVLGLPPTWYKDSPYRSRVVRDPRGVLREFGTELPTGTEIRVWDSSAEMRYLVLPRRPAGTAEHTEAELVELISRDSMIGVTEALPAAAA
jgi:nitrile hydratase